MKKKMTNKIIISLVIIVCLVLFLLISGRNKSGAPALKPWKGTPDYVLIQKGGQSLYLQNIEGNWFINDEKYPADSGIVEKFIERINKLKLTDTISSRPFYERYGLDPSQEMLVVVKQKDRVLREAAIGNTTSTGHHSFIRIDDKPEVYQTNEVFDADQNMNVQEYRDKRICKIKESDIITIAVTSNRKTFTFSKTSDNSEKASGEDVWSCKEFAGESIDQNKLKQLVFSAAGLRASGFIEPPEKGGLGASRASLLIGSADSEVLLTFFPYSTASKPAHKAYAVTSSAAETLFLVDEWQAEKFLIENISEYMYTKSNTE